MLPGVSNVPPGLQGEPHHDGVNLGFRSTVCPCIRIEVVLRDNAGKSRLPVPLPSSRSL